MRPSALLLSVLVVAWLHSSSAMFDLPADKVNLYLTSKPPVTNWLLTPTKYSATTPNGLTPAQRTAWKKIGAKIWTLLSHMDHDFVDADQFTTIPPSIARAQGSPAGRIFPAQCGRLARQTFRMPFHDCGAFDIGNTGSVGDTGKPRGGCNASIRRELAACPQGPPGTPLNPNCMSDGQDKLLNLTTGASIDVGAFDLLKQRFPTAKIDFAIPTNPARPENTGFMNILAFMWQLKLEAAAETSTAYRISVSLSDVIVYAGMLGVAKCGGPQVQFQPGRVDLAGEDGPFRLPAADEPLPHTISYFWTNGLTNFDAVNLLTAHTCACFSIGCMDATAQRFDDDWADQVLSIQSGTDLKICQFVEPDIVGGDAKPPTVPTKMCILPADAVLASRADTILYLRAQISNNAEAITDAAAMTGAPYSPVGACPLIQGGACTVRAAVYKPFKVLPEANMCTHPGVAPADKVNCGVGSSQDTQPNLNNLFSTSFFKLSKMHTNYQNGVKVPHDSYDIRFQPCQPHTIMIGTVAPTQNPKCSCCYRQPWPQTFNFELVIKPVGAVSIDEQEAVVSAAAVSSPLDYLDMPPPARGYSGDPSAFNPIVKTVSTSDPRDASSSQLLGVLQQEMVQKSDDSSGKSDDSKSEEGSDHTHKRKRGSKKIRRTRRATIPAPQKPVEENLTVRLPEVPPASPEDKLPTRPPKVDDNPSGHEIIKLPVPPVTPVVPAMPEDQPAPKPVPVEPVVPVVPPTSTEDSTDDPAVPPSSPEDNAEVPPPSPDDSTGSVDDSDGSSGGGSGADDPTPAFALEAGGGRRMLYNSHSF